MKPTPPPIPSPPPTPSQLPEAEKKKLLALLEELSQAVENLLMTGLTTASDATRAKLDVGLKEASRMRLLRLGSTLRLVSEEIGRYTANSAAFSRRRFSFFLNRAWLLCKGLAHALRKNDAALLEKLLWMPAGVAVKSVDVVLIGVSKRVVQGAFFAFDFRFRAAKKIEVPGADGKPLAIERLSWSCGHRYEAELPPEGIMHLAQGNTFKPIFLLENPAVTIENVQVTPDGTGGARLGIHPKTELKKGKPVTEWGDFLKWDATTALERARNHQAGPLDLDVELQEEIVLERWEMGDEQPGLRDDQSIFPIVSGGIEFSAVVSKSVEGEVLRGALLALKKKKKLPPLFALMHYENCRLILQTLSVLGKSGMAQLMLSKEKIDPKALLKTMNFQKS